MRRHRCYRKTLDGNIGMLIVAIAALPIIGLFKIICGDAEELGTGILLLVIGIIIWAVVL